MKSLSKAVAAVLMLAAFSTEPPPAIGQPQSEEVFSASDLDRSEGGALYQRRCMNCHGPDGDALDGIDVARRSVAMTDDDLLRTIINGTGSPQMPPSGLTAFEAGTVSAYLRFIAGDRITASDGDATRGQSLVEGSAGCLNCHTIDGRGSLMAPDLTRIGSLRRSAALRNSLKDPNAAVRTENRYVDVHLNDGTIVRGRLLNQDSFSVQILSTDERLKAISKSDLDELEFIDTPMPSFAERFTPQELNDVVRYLASLQ